MKRRYTLWYSIAALVLLLPLACWGNSAEIGEALFEEYTLSRQVPLASQMGELSEPEAYEAQKAFVNQWLKADGVAGFKAGCTTQDSQSKFGLSGPVAGTLYRSGKYSGSPVILASRFTRPMLECEIGFWVSKKIDKPISSVAKLKKYIGAVMPAIEIPALYFTDLKALKGVDLIVGNVGAAAFIVGPKFPVSAPINDITVTLSREGEEINRGKGSDALGNQWEAALWLVNQRISQGWIIQPGQVLLTGALGKMLPAKPGTYTAAYGELGEISFQIR